VYGPVRTVVWEDGGREAPSYPIWAPHIVARVVALRSSFGLLAGHLQKRNSTHHRKTHRFEG
jgi:hypothetical protein